MKVKEGMGGVTLILLLMHLDPRQLSVASHADWRWYRTVRARHRTAALDDSVCIFRLDQRSKSKSSWLWNLGDVHLLAQCGLDRRRRSDRGGEMGEGR